ncbi:hypothetical protein ABZ918_06485 [Streptomyces viridosporus]|uniref:hypothetical protein n=1 Tax=Streptomyces viridosporus TaxID=67581 RepID=UPI00342295D2
MGADGKTDLIDGTEIRARRPATGHADARLTPPHRKSKKNASDRHEEMHERQCQAHSSLRVRVEHGIAHPENWRAPARPLGRREHTGDTVQTGRRPAVPPADRGLGPGTTKANTEAHRTRDASPPTTHELGRQKSGGSS